MSNNESTPLLQNDPKLSKTRAVFSSANRVLLAGFLISVALSFTQVPILYLFRLMECEEFYGNHDTGNLLGDRCNRSEIDAGTATQVSILGLSTMFCSVINLFYAGWQIKNWGPKVALVLQTAFPALRVGVQVVGVSVGARSGIIIVQCSQLISLIGGMSGYLLVLNTIAGEITPPSERTAMFGMLQGSVMLGISIGYLLGGIVGDSWGIIRPFEIATILFALSSLYSSMFIPYIDPRTPGIVGGTSAKRQGWSRWLGALRVLAPKRFRLEDGRPIKHYGVAFLALGVFLGVLATGYAPILIQLYSTAAFNFLPTENSYLMASNSLIRGVFLLFIFPRIIDSGRKWYTGRSEKELQSEVFRAQVLAETEAGVTTDVHPKPNNLSEATVFQSVPGHEFDISFLRWSLVADGLLTASTAFATKGWHIYLAGVLFPLASGSAPASKGVITEMCAPSERTDALQAMTLVENVAMLSTLGLFGFIFSSFAGIEKAYLTFFCNAGVAMAAVAVLLLSSFPPPNGLPDDQNTEIE
ncbi:major facilitator superfamily transporter [Colletotrichum chrysophilum]|uniref:Major facilitator superfamily transporter n=1 Tax=Colletotrichum chrysophilum TaxID=1836956 RepID=A0AAD9AVJ2_9PEZI|nr:major facilitator superfamily transporter [Colletotrichum chrysophilum]